MSAPSRNLWERTKDLARKAGEEARTVSVQDLESGEEEQPAVASEPANDEVENEIVRDAESDDEPGEDPTGR